MGKIDDSGVNLVIVGIVICALIVIVVMGIAVWKMAASSSGPSLHKAMLKPAGGAVMTSEQLSKSMDLLQARLIDYGYGMPVTGLTDQDGNSFVVLNYVNQPYDELIDVATMTGRIEMRIRTSGSESVHVLNRDDIATVSAPVEDNTKPWGVWSVTIKLNETGAKTFQKACIDAGATTSPTDHEVIMLLDDKAINSFPLSTVLANAIAKGPVDTMQINTGTGEIGKTLAKKIYVSLKDGALPVKLEVAR